MWFWNGQKDAEFRFVLCRHLMSRTTLYDMEVDVTGKFVRHPLHGVQSFPSRPLPYHASGTVKELDRGQVPQQP